MKQRVMLWSRGLCFNGKRRKERWSVPNRANVPKILWRLLKLRKNSLKVASRK
jgi:hypothetical protein